ncbi:hypothetical protein [Roseomonas sp. WA12]
MNTSSQVRFLAAALADRLIYGSMETFHGEEAVELLDLLPRPGLGAQLLAYLPGIEMKGTIPRGGVRGAAAGGLGNVSFDQGSHSFEFDSAGRRVVRAGQWKLTRTASLMDRIRQRETVSITQVMGDAKDELEAQILFQERRPSMMKRSVSHTTFFGPTAVIVTTFKPWKTPVWGEDREAWRYEASNRTRSAGWPCLQM